MEPTKGKVRKKKSERAEEKKMKRHDMGVFSRAIFVRQGPQKIRIVADLIRGKSAEEALNILTFCRKKAAKTLKKILNSAIANADENRSIDVDELFVKSVQVDQAPTVKRFRPRAMGRATRVQKKNSHIEMILDKKE